jgi:hypothetical protein
MNQQLWMAVWTRVQLACVQDQVAWPRVDVRVTGLAQKIVTKRVLKLAFVHLDFGLGHVNVVSRALARTPHISKGGASMHLFLLTSGFWKKIPSACWKEFPPKFNTFGIFFFTVCGNMEFQLDMIIILYVFSYALLKINGDTWCQFNDISVFYHWVSKIFACGRNFAGWAENTIGFYWSINYCSLFVKLKYPNKELQKTWSVKS